MTRFNLHLCSRCGRCLSVCPTYASRKQEPFSPRGRIFLLSRGLSDHPGIHACLLCGRCETVCPNRVQLPSALWLERRKKGWIRLPLGISALPKEGSWRERLWPRRFPRRASRTLSESGKWPRKGNVILFLSCGAEYLYPQGTSALRDLLQDLGDSPTFTQPLCCGLPLASWGSREAFERQARKTLEKLEETEGPLITLCASCLWTIRDLYPLIFSGPTREKALRVARRTKEALSYLREKDWRWETKISRLVFHLPCHLKGELPNRSWGRVPVMDVCCGSPSPQSLFFTRRPSRDLRQALKDISPDLLVTACTGCYLKLKETLIPPPEIRHWTELIGV